MPTTSPKHIRTMDMLVIDNVFGMGDGYVLNFSNRTFSEFFAEELGVDIDQPRWSVNGASKAKRLRTYLRHADRETALRTLQALWDYRETSGLVVDHPVIGEDGRTAFFRIIKRLGGTPPASTTPDTDHAPQCPEPDLANELAARLITISGMDPQRKRVRVREVPQTRLRRLRFGRACFVPSARRARSTAASRWVRRPTCSKRSGRMPRSTGRRSVHSTPRSKTRRGGHAGSW